jgi:Leucine-rich repeat (LRR) protein
LIAFASVFRGVKLEEKTIQCEGGRSWDDDRDRWRAWCGFKNVTFNQDTKLNIERIGLPGLTDGDIDDIWFRSSSVFLFHSNILAIFPNIREVRLNSENKLNNPEKFENCQDITDLTLKLKDFDGISSNTFDDCKKLESLRIEIDSLTDLPDGLFRNQENLRTLKLSGNSALRVSSFEGLKSLNEFYLASMDVSQVEENFFQSLNIKRLFYGGIDKDHTFPIKSLKSQETIEELAIIGLNLSQLPANFGPILRSMKKLRKIEFSENSIRSVEAFVDLPNVEWINLTNNKIVELPYNAFKGCPRLAFLYLESNPIKALRGDEFNQLSGLKELILTNTKLTSIPPTTFHPLRSLESLELSGAFTGTNNIISKELFMSSTNLIALGLAGNNIHAIHPEAFANQQKLIYLDLRGNICVGILFRNSEKLIDMTRVREKLKTCFENFFSQKGL